MSTATTLPAPDDLTSPPGYNPAWMPSTQNLRKLTIARMAELGITTYRLSVMLKGKVPPNTLYSWLRGERDILAESVGHVLDALGYELTPRKGWKVPESKARGGRG